MKSSIPPSKVVQGHPDHALLSAIKSEIIRRGSGEAQFKSWVCPHAIAFDGFRWHARAFCLTDEVFKDFLLSRMLEIRGSRDSDTSAPPW